MAEDIFKDLYVDDSDTKSLSTKENGLVSNKVSNFSYTSTAYNSDQVSGVTSYSYANEQNIPEATSTVLETSQTVLNKGFRAQASSIPRMLINHLFGRTSYNLNKINDFFSTFLGKFRTHLLQNDCVYSPSATYTASNTCFILDSDNNKRSFYCVATSPISGESPLDSDGNVTAYWREISTSSVNGKHGAVTVYGSDIAVSSTNSQTVEGFVNSVGQANGLASLDENGRLPYSQLPESAIEYKGTWDASTNTPSIADGTGTNGDFYIVSVAGTWNEIEFTVNDRIICSGSGTEAKWSKLEGGNVNSVNSVLPVDGDVSISGTDIPVRSGSTQSLTDYVTGFQSQPKKVTQAQYDATPESERADNYFIILDGEESTVTDINDDITATDTTWSSQKIDAEIEKISALTENLKYETVNTYAALLNVDTSEFGNGLYVYTVRFDERFPVYKSDNETIDYLRASLNIYLSTTAATAATQADKWRTLGLLNMSEGLISKTLVPYSAVQQTVVDNESSLASLPVSSTAVNGALAEYDLPATIKVMLRISAPNGWLLCDGTEYNRSDYPNLWNCLKDFDAFKGDGVSTFTVPDLRNRYLCGADETYEDKAQNITHALGNVLENGLPNSTGYCDGSYLGSNRGSYVYKGSFTLSNGSYVGTNYEYVNSYKIGMNIENGRKYWETDTLGLSANTDTVYGNSITVTPKSICINYFIKY